LDDFIDAINLSKTRLNDLERINHSSLFSQYSADLLINLRDLPGVRLLDVIREVFLKSDNGNILRHKASLEALVELGAFWETTDPKDAIYAFLNISRDFGVLMQSLTNNTLTLLLLNYSNSLLLVFVQFIEHCVSLSDSIDIILRPWAPVSPGINAHIIIDPGLINNCPSWICSRNRLPFGNLSRRHRV
jgi:hypothetical protein